MKGFNYDNTESKIQSGGKVVRKVSIKKGRGYKSVTKYHKGKKMYTVKKPIHKEHIKLIKKGIFIPGLFQDCRGCKTKKRRGGGDIKEGRYIEEGRDIGRDIEEGPEILDVEHYPVPPDPERFAEYERRMRTTTSTPLETEQLFAGPTPEARQAAEAEQMASEDPLNQDPFYREELQIFPREGGRKRRKL